MLHEPGMPRTMNQNDSHFPGSCPSLFAKELGEMLQALPGLGIQYASMHSKQANNHDSKPARIIHNRLGVIRGYTVQISWPPSIL